MSRPQQPRKSSFRPVMEVLEDRFLLSNAPLPISAPAADSVPAVQTQQFSENWVKQVYNDLLKGSAEFGSFLSLLQPGSIGGGTGGGSAKVTIQDVIITKWTDKASPGLFQQCCVAETFSEVTIVAQKADSNTPLQFLDYSFNTVSVTGFHWTPSGGDASTTQSLSLTFKIYPGQKTPSGSPVPLLVYSFYDKYVSRIQWSPLGSDNMAQESFSLKFQSFVTDYKGYKVATTDSIESKWNQDSSGTEESVVDQSLCIAVVLTYGSPQMTVGPQDPGANQGRQAPKIYENSFTCIPAPPPFRPLQQTLIPQTGGLLNSAAEEEIFTDKYGRVKVQFHWDRQGRNNADSSCWMRVSSLWAGKQWGMIHLPRIGQEVVVDFLEGDPDQLIVVGSVYKAGPEPNLADS